MVITKEEFERYERVRFRPSVDYVKIMSGLSKDKIIKIRDTFNSLSEKYRR